MRYKARVDVSTDAPVALVGGGLTGISAALHLGTRGIPWRLFEKRERLGGHARTDVRDGFHFDQTGHWLHLRDDGVKRLVNEALPGQLQPVARKSRIFSHGVLTRYPFQANLHGLPPDVIKECLLGYLARPADLAPVTFEDFCLRHFGEGISRHFMIPYNARLWGVHPREITAEWCQRFVPIPKLEDVVAGAVGASPPELGYNVSFLYPKTGGIETLTRALATRLSGGQVAVGVDPERIDLGQRTMQVGGETVRFSALVASLPLPELLRRIVDLPAELEKAGSQLRCTAVRYLNVALKTPPAMEHHWLYVPEERYPFYRVGCYTNAAPGSAPAGRGSLYVELADRSATEAAVLPDVIAGLAAAGVITGPEHVLFSELREIEYAYVVFDHAYYGATSTILPWLEARGIYPRGRYGSWTYNGMEDCILAGRDVAETIARAGTGTP